ncbi:Di/tripeptide transport system permease protein DppB [Rhodovastum atsumiense]|uniref:ABC transporter permease n=1 Tax=Rhodovastum atsumiense TaxID=504468 RepID=A0A5M6IQ56_9PROT|nr:ABC transporter permease [Rhodovastum atsumiense]KAA5610049.1 ABC transporter permease [Rhodovastum atsumiense]CAH2602956.1 Di/tripeptide transport system permease protein DppB [Rhodovastum atsumiense]
MPGTVAFICRRLLKAAFVLGVVVVLNFLLIHAAPGDPATVMAGEAGAADPLFLEQLRHQFGLDQPLLQQLGTYVGHVLQGDLGFSYRQQRPVWDLLSDRLAATVALTLTAFLLALAGGILLGTLAALHVGRLADTAITVLALLFYATPIYWIGLMLVLLFSVQLGWLPAFGFETVGAGLAGMARLADITSHMALPVLTLGLFYMAVYARLTRASVLEVSTLDFVKTARAKGQSEGKIVVRHVLRNALLPVITMAGIQAGQLVGGSILVETVFAWPGLGRLTFDAVLQRDYQVLLGVFFVTSVLVIVFNILTDLLYSLVDPRVELA